MCGSNKLIMSKFMIGALYIYFYPVIVRRVRRMERIEMGIRQGEALELERLQQRLDFLNATAVIPHEESDEEGK